MSWDLRTRLAVLLSAVVWVAAAARLPGLPCATPPHHHFDFVIGNWLVRDSSGRATGTLTVAREFGGCVLIERWQGAAHSGEGLGVLGYRPESGRWHREFLDAGGGVLAMDGDRDTAAMRMQGREYTADGVQRHRIAWSPRADGAVEERWETSVDDGRSWQVRFRGFLYRIAE